MVMHYDTATTMDEKLNNNNNNNNNEQQLLTLIEEDDDEEQQDQQKDRKRNYNYKNHNEEEHQHHAHFNKKNEQHEELLSSSTTKNSINYTNNSAKVLIVFNIIVFVVMIWIPIVRRNYYFKNDGSIMNQQAAAAAAVEYDDGEEGESNMEMISPENDENRVDNIDLSSADHDGEDQQFRPAPRNNILYGFIHMAKTGGTTLNGELSMHYERICGNKGFSYDAIQNNERIRKASNNGTNPVTETYDTGDIIAKTYEERNRGRVPPKAMKEIGYEDCDWIGYEANSYIWQKIYNFAMANNLDLELHLPCRDPIDHLLSMCNHKWITFDCTKVKQSKSALKKQIKKCALGTDRFSMELLNRDHMDLKCFTSPPTDEYIKYMGARLEKRRIEIDYVHRDTNRKRNKDEECIWEDKELIDQTKEMMFMEYEYFGFCHSCIGSERDLFLGGDGNK